MLPEEQRDILAKTLRFIYGCNRMVENAGKGRDRWWPYKNTIEECFKKAEMKIRPDKTYGKCPMCTEGILQPGHNRKYYACGLCENTFEIKQKA